MAIMQVTQQLQKLPDTHAWVNELVADAPLLIGKIQQNTSCKAPSQAKNALAEVTRFMYLCAHSKSTLTPSALVDSVWHEFILFTRSYATFCEQQFGNFIHHQPSANQTNELLQYQQTLLGYQHHFGHADALFWPQPQVEVAQCGPCENA